MTLKSAYLSFFLKLVFIKLLYLHYISLRLASKVILIIPETNTHTVNNNGVRVIFP